jgi:hypothetical protein
MLPYFHAIIYLSQSFFETVIRGIGRNIRILQIFASHATVRFVVVRSYRFVACEVIES